MRRAALLALLMLALAGCGGDGGGGGQAAAGVRELTNVLQLRGDFEADAGKTRVLLLFSPT